MTICIFPHDSGVLNLTIFSMSLRSVTTKRTKRYIYIKFEAESISCFKGLNEGHTQSCFWSEKGSRKLGNWRMALQIIK